MMNTIPNRQVICEVLMGQAERDKNLVVLCSDSRGSASLGPFAKRYPAQFVEVGIAEQNLVSMAAGLAAVGKNPYVAAPASFLSTRSLEQIKVDVAYSGMPVKLVGISGGISYGALGMTHHSAQDIAAIASIPGMRVYLPSDRFQTRALFDALRGDGMPAYIRVGRNAVADVYSKGAVPFAIDRANILKAGLDAALIACGEMVRPALDAAILLEKKGIHCRVLDMHSLKPLDTEAVISACRECRVVLTAEEHSPFGGLGAMVSQLAAKEGRCRVQSLTLPDTPVIAGKSQEVFDYYGLNATGMAEALEELLS